MTWSVLRDSRRVFAPLVVTAHMSEPIVYVGDGLHLDGILAAAAFRDLDERTRRRIPPLSSPWAVDIMIPLSRWVVEVGDDWVGDVRLLRKRKGGGARRPRQTRELWGWCASAVQAEWVQYGKTEIRKRPEVDKMRRYARDKSVSVGAGPLKAYDLPLPTVFAAEVRWYCHGVAADVERLLRTHIGAIGKKHLLGHGTVMHWAVEPCEHDLSVAHEGSIMRRMPLESGLDGRCGRGAIRPPYHHHSRVVESVEPSCSS